MFAEALASTEVQLLPLEQALKTASVFTDGDWVESKDQDPNGEVRLTQLADVGDGTWLDKSARFLTAAKAEQLRCTLLEPGDVLVARMPDPLGRACVFPGNERPCVTVVDVCVIRPDPGAHTSDWLAACINSPSVRQQVGRFATGTTRSRVSRGNLKKVLVPDVPLRVQKAYSGRMEGLARLRAQMLRTGTLESELASTLTARAFNGEL